MLPATACPQPLHMPRTCANGPNLREVGRGNPTTLHQTPSYGNGERTQCSVSGPGTLSLSVSGLGALSLAVLCRGPVVSGPVALCVGALSVLGPRRALSGPALSASGSPALSVSGPRALCVGPRRSLCQARRSPALSLSGPALFVGPSALCVRPRRSLCRVSMVSVSRPGDLTRAPALSLRQALVLSVSGPAVGLWNLCRALCRAPACRGPAVSVSGPGIYRARRSSALSVSAPALSVSEPSAFCVRRSLCRDPALSVSGPIRRSLTLCVRPQRVFCVGPSLCRRPVLSVSCAALSVSGPVTLSVGPRRSLCRHSLATLSRSALFRDPALSAPGRAHPHASIPSAAHASHGPQLRSACHSSDPPQPPIRSELQSARHPSGPAGARHPSSPALPFSRREPQTLLFGGEL